MFDFAGFSGSPALFLLHAKDVYVFAGNVACLHMGSTKVFMQRKVLVVEDDPDQLEIIRLSLKAAGFAIGTATNGIDGLKKAHSVSPDLIVLDVMMPEMNGFAVCETLRGNPATAAIPIVMLTGLCSHISRLVGVEAGATDYLMKPFDPRQLVSKVEKLLNLSPTTPAEPVESGTK